MATRDRYAYSIDESRWDIPGAFDTTFRWEYEDSRDKLSSLYKKGKRLQWDVDTRIDWSQDLDPENPQEMPDESISIYGSDIWNRMDDREKANLRRHAQSWQLSQFLHGEQGALICTAKIVQQVPDMDAKFYAATQVMDEARHVAFWRLALRDYYPELTDQERDEREEFAVDACYLMRDRFLAEEVWETVGLPVEECIGYVDASQEMREFRSRLFSRIVPAMKDIGLWGPRIRRAYSHMGILGFSDVDLDAMTKEDERLAEQFDRG